MTRKSTTREILNLDEIAERTKRPVSTLRYWRLQGKGGPPMFTLGRRVVAYADEVDAWIAAQREAAIPNGPAA